MKIESYDAEQKDAVVDLSLRAWAPVFESIENAMDPAVYREFYPDWRVVQAEAVSGVLAAEETHVWTANKDGSTAGFVAVKLDDESKMGEIYMIAVDPEHQGGGVGIALTNFAVEWMRDQGMSIAMVETGGDPGHGPARQLYERAGFGLLPVARYFKKL